MNKKQQPQRKSAPTVRIARPSKRPYQLRYRCPIQNKEVRISLSTRDELEAERQRAETEARLVLGLSARPTPRIIANSDITWDEFREQYRTLHLATLRDGSAEAAEVRLDVAQRIIKPKFLKDLADPQVLHELQARIQRGEASKNARLRSSSTVKSYMGAVLAALNWAKLLGWIEKIPEIRKVKIAKQMAMKGRPLSVEEFQRMLDVTSQVVGEEAADSWRYLLQGFWESALRLEEIMNVSWDQEGFIRPIWSDGDLPLLEIPAHLQKNNTDQQIPMLPGFEALILMTAPDHRVGWVFNPLSLQRQIGRGQTLERLSAKWVGKIVTRIGKKANVVVKPANEKLRQPAKYASAHDLRRSCGERLREAGVPPLVICTIMRHSSWEITERHYAPGNIQRDAELLRTALSQ